MELATLKEAMEQLTSAFPKLNIAAEELEPGECEVGVMVPRAAIENDLSSLAFEFKEFDFILKTISEIVTGSVHSNKVRTISSSDFLVFVSQHAAEAALLAMIMEKLIESYKKILEIKKLHSELAVLMEKKSIKEVEKHAEGEMTKAIDAIVQEAFKRNKVKEPGRKNELNSALNICVRKLADRIDRGFNVEIRVEPLRISEQGDEIETNTGGLGVADFLSYQAAIENAAKVLEFTHSEGAPILHLEHKHPSRSKDETN